MIDLGRFHMENLWVTDLSFEDDNVRMRGYALDALAVPQWLSNLQQSAYFSGKSFAMMQLSNETPKAGLIEFEISTVAEKMLSGEEKMAAIDALKETAPMKGAH